MIFPPGPQVQAALDLIAQLNQRGHQAYLVGGCVRDALLGREITDFDLCTSATPQEIQALFPKTVATGLAFGTITVLSQGFSFEITSFRGEVGYSDGRHPDQIALGVTLEEDLARRDFTINALAYHPEEGLLDPFGGQAHLEVGLLQAVGVAEQRFTEDSLRILRALRFSATLGLVIEDDTAQALLSCWEGLRRLPQERITQEMKKLVMGQHLHRLLYFMLIFEEGIFPGLPCLYEAEEAWQLQRKLEGISAAPLHLPLRLALFLSLFVPDSGLLRLSKQEAQAVDFLLAQDCLIWRSPEELTQLVCQHGRAKMELLLHYQIYHYPYHQAQLQALVGWLEDLPCTCYQELDLSGFDLIAAGVTPGETVGRLLAIALELVVSGQAPNDNGQLLELILGPQNPGEIPE